MARIVSLFVVSALALTTTACSSLTRPDEIQIAPEPPRAAPPEPARVADAPPQRRPQAAPAPAGGGG
jgi:hypothetical protein